MKDTKDFLQKLEKVKDIPEDVESLYTNVPNNEDIKAVNESYEKYGAMAIICAPSNANTFMIDFERKHIYPYIDEGFYYVLENHKV